MPACRGFRVVLEEERAPTPEDRLVHRRQLPGGMGKLELVLEPDEADLILRAIERAREVRAEHAEMTQPAAAAGVSAETSWPSRADGAVTLTESFLAGHPVTGSGGERFQVLEDGSRVSAETLRRVACGCGLVAVGSRLK